METAVPGDMELVLSPHLMINRLLCCQTNHHRVWLEHRPVLSSALFV